MNCKLYDCSLFYQCSRDQIVDGNEVICYRKRKTKNPLQIDTTELTITDMVEFDFSLISDKRKDPD